MAQGLQGLGAGDAGARQGVGEHIVTEQAEHAADYAALKAVVKERNALTAIGQPAYLLPTRQRQSCRRICTDEAEFV